MSFQLRVFFFSLQLVIVNLNDKSRIYNNILSSFHQAMNRLTANVRIATMVLSHYIIINASAKPRTPQKSLS